MRQRDIILLIVFGAIILYCAKILIYASVNAITDGELIYILDGKATLEIDNVGGIWMVSMSIFDFTGAELIDCLFDACVKLKEE